MAKKETPIKQVAAAGVDRGAKNYHYASDPDSCPVCHHAIEPTRHGEASVCDDADTMEIPFRCPRRSCGRLFVARYRRSAGSPQGGDWFVWIESVPLLPDEPRLSADIGELSPSFVKIYGQAIAAESHGLDEVCGVGYRKALEFLIKDLCVHINPSAEDAIKKEPLGSVIANRVEGEQLKECARRATWLGNDETHYVRRWEGKDLQDLKLLVKLAVAWVEQHLLSEKFKKEMPNPKQASAGGA